MVLAYQVLLQLEIITIRKSVDKAPGGLHKEGKPMNISCWVHTGK